MIVINGKEYPYKRMSLSELLLEKGYKLTFVAVELNGDIVPKKDYSGIMINDCDTLEVVSFVGGG